MGDEGANSMERRERSPTMACTMACTHCSDADCRREECQYPGPIPVSHSPQRSTSVRATQGLLTPTSRLSPYPTPLRGSMRKVLGDGSGSGIGESSEHSSSSLRRRRGEGSTSDLERGGIPAKRRSVPTTRSSIGALSLGGMDDVLEQDVVRVVFDEDPQHIYGEESIEWAMDVYPQWVPGAAGRDSPELTSSSNVKVRELSQPHLLLHTQHQELLARRNQGKERPRHPYTSPPPQIYSPKHVVHIQGDWGRDAKMRQGLTASDQQISMFISCIGLVMWCAQLALSVDLTLPALAKNQVFWAVAFIGGCVGVIASLLQLRATCSSPYALPNRPILLMELLTVSLLAAMLILHISIFLACIEDVYLLPPGMYEPFCDSGGSIISLLALEFLLAAIHIIRYEPIKPNSLRKAIWLLMA
ncbi:unnamed protein product [Chrysoparadoxa australica]